MEVNFFQYTAGSPCNAARQQNELRFRGKTMKHAFRQILAGSLLIFSLGANIVKAEGDSSLDSHLEPLRSLLGKTWKGAFKDSKPEKPTVDVSRWERILNGKAI